ncbi:hypothetical protein FSP39_010873 [Pinctada imbricata]|uniref:Protocadherin-20 n=1 Tax=Pinctada imbricata TaxID=66713 RepID=A0AA88Y7D6_PINIB|nr:hypothetical protein FSP39_010873 [Pinctada imbricata]
MDQHLGITITCILVTLVCSQNINVEFNIDEGKAAGELIGNVATQSRLNDTVDEAVIRSLKYTFLEPTDFTTKLTLNGDTGDLFTAVLIDREKIESCGNDPECVVTFTIAANIENNPNFYLITTKIRVRDVNDNSPEFPEQTLQKNVSESVPIGYTIQLPAATDDDSGPNNGIEKYELFPPNTPFVLNVTKKLDGSFLVQLVVNAPLDREITDRYIVQVFAKDGGTPTPNSGKLQVDIKVLDVNDNKPIFSKSVYNKTVSEDTQPGTTILRVNATDKDAGENGRVMYQFSRSSPHYNKISELFVMNNQTGDIILKQGLIYEGDGIYTIFVEATDQGEKPEFAQAQVNVQVEDVGNNKPIVKVNLLSGTGNGVLLSESAKLGSFVAHVNVEDPDKGENGRVECEAYPSIFGIESLSESGYKVVIEIKLDRETSDLHNVTVTCRDFGTPRLSSSEHFLVHVTDDNDNDPVFLRDLYVASITENDIVGRSVVQVSARDADDGVNAQIIYHLHSDAGANFVVNSVTGVITAEKSFDREERSDYKFQVLAVDQGNPKRTSTSSVIVTINDVNDNSPKFNQTQFVFDIRENLDVETRVGIIAATDADTGENAKLHYYMDSNDKFSVPFVVFPDGLIKSNQELDREFQSQYHFVVYAADSGNVSLSSSVYVTVYVTDDNDNEPIITFPNKMNNTVTSPVTSLPVTTIRANDKDEGINKKLVYYIHSGNENGMFKLNQNSGELLLNRDFPISTDQSVSLLICVKDSGVPIKTKCAQLNVLVTVNNATAAPLSQENNNKYITISIVVVIVTILISVAIVVTILFIRRIDQNRQKLKNTQGPLGLPMQNGLPTTSTSGNDPAQEQEFLERNSKKEVTFSSAVRDDGNSVGSSKGNYSLNLTNETRGLYDKPPAYSTIGKAPSDDSKIEALNALKLQQILLKSSTEHAQPVSRPHPSDNHSDTSGETIPSDSGRGGSEDDVPSTSLTHDDSRSFDFTNANATLSPISYLSPVYGLDSPPVRPPRPPSRAVSYQSSDKRHSTNYEKLKIPTSAINPNYSYLSYNDSYRINNQTRSPTSASKDWDFIRHDSASRYSNIPKDRDYFNLGPGSISTMRSRDDDDDAATTTSGSYTINPEELDDELGFKMQKDLVV